jgi:hypothetical protein
MKALLTGAWLALLASTPGAQTQTASLELMKSCKAAISLMENQRAEPVQGAICLGYRAGMRDATDVSRRTAIAFRRM